MKLKINKDKFIEKLSEASVIIRENSVKPIISGIKLVAKDNMVTLIATTLEFNYIANIEAEVSEEGEAVFKIPLVLEYIKLLEEETLELKIEGQHLKIQNATFSVFEASEFPHISVGDDSTELFEIEGSKFAEMLDKVKFSIFQTIENVGLNTLRIKCTSEEIRMVATDSFRLVSLVEKNISSKEDTEFSISLDNINSIFKLMKNNSSIFKILVQENRLEFRSSDEFISARFTDAQYPDYETIFNNLTSNKKIELNTTEFKKNIKSAMALAKNNLETKNGAKFLFKGNKLTLEVVLGRAKTKLRQETIKEGDDLMASLNIKYIYEFLEKIDKNLIIEASNSSTMFIFKEVDNEDYIYVLMPLAIRE